MPEKTRDSGRSQHPTTPFVLILNVVRRLSEKFTTAIVTGRGKEKVKEFVKLDNLFYAGRYAGAVVYISECLTIC